MTTATIGIDSFCIIALDGIYYPNPDSRKLIPHQVDLSDKEKSTKYLSGIFLSYVNSLAMIDEESLDGGSFYEASPKNITCDYSFVYQDIILTNQVLITYNSPDDNDVAETLEQYEADIAVMLTRVDNKIDPASEL